MENIKQYTYTGKQANSSKTKNVFTIQLSSFYLWAFMPQK